jgi:purine-binding chemotaxis protein CheW
MQETDVSSLAGKYLILELAGQEYGLELLKVREIIGMMPITVVPRMPSFVRGIINLRGQVIPVLELRSKFGMAPASGDERRCIAIVHVGELQVGMIVDRVLEVLDVSADEIDRAPSFGVDVDTTFILGIARSGRGVTILLDVEEVLHRSETDTMKSAAEAVVEAVA